MRFKKPRLGPQLLRQASQPGFFNQTHVIFGGTGAVGGATALQMIDLFQEAGRRFSLKDQVEPRIVITGRTKQELRQFTALLFEVQRRDRGRPPERIDGIGYRLCDGVILELTTFELDASLPGLAGFSERDDQGQRDAMRRFLRGGGLELEEVGEEQIAYLQRVLEEGVGKPFTDFLAHHSTQRGLGPDGRSFKSVVVSIPLASFASYGLTGLEDAGSMLGLQRGSDRMRQLKDAYLRALRDDLANVAEHLADEVLAAHTTAVGGMYDEEENDRRVIRLGFAHSALDVRLADKQLFAERLARLYAEKGIKMLITAAAIGVDQVLVRESPPINGAIRRQLLHAVANGHPLFAEGQVSTRMRVYAPMDLDLLEEAHEPLTFKRGRSLVVDYVVKSGENGFFTVSNTDALYRVMRVTSGSELGLLLARTALFGDDPHCPSFPGNTCYYTETDNSRQVFELLGQPKLRQSQLSGLQPKALQDLGSAKHQGELHLLGLLILLHRLKTLDLDAIPAHVHLATFNPQEYFEAHSRVLTLEHVASWRADVLATELTRLATARDEEDLRPLKSFFQADPDRQEAAHRVLQEVLHAAWAVPSIGTPILYEQGGRRRVVAGYYAAAIDRILTHRDSFGAFFHSQIEKLGGSGGASERLIEFHIANNGFVDLRPLAVLVAARSDRDDLTGKVRVFRDEAAFLKALAELEPYSYFTTSGLIALLVRLKGLCQIAHELDLKIGTANEFRAHLPHDNRGRPLLIPGVVEAFRMVSEGLEKNTGSERLDGRWGYYLER